MPFTFEGRRIAEGQGNDGRLHDLSLRVGALTASVNSIGETSVLTRTELKREAELIRKAIDGLASEMSKEFERADSRIDRLEITIAEQAAEARGVRKAMRWGAAALTALGSALGWVMATWGSAITSALGFGGPLNGGK